VSQLKDGVKQAEKESVSNPMKSSKYRVRLNADERVTLRELLVGGLVASRQVTRAHILLKADENGRGWTDNEIAVALEVSTNTVAKVRQQFVKEGLAGALERHPPQRTYARCLDGAQEAHLMALACSEAPAGYARWTLRLLAEQMVDLGYVEQLCYETVRRVLKKRTQTLAQTVLGDPTTRQR
jgi:transposase